MKPVIYYNIHDLKQFVGKSFKEIYETTENLRKRTKEAAGYSWDNSHFFLQGFGGNLISLLFSSDAISVYDTSGTEYILTLSSETFTAKETKELEVTVNNYAKGLRKCNECGEWIELGRIKRYGFAGIVCFSCYRPTKHVSADTRGD